MQETLLLDMPHRQAVFTVPKRLRVFFKYKRQLLGGLCRAAIRAMTKKEAERVRKYMIWPLLSLERLSFLDTEGKVGYRYGQGACETETLDYLEFIARVTSYIPDKGQVMVRYYGLYANAHRGKARKTSLATFPLRIVEEELRRVPS